MHYRKNIFCTNQTFRALLKTQTSYRNSTATAMSSVEKGNKQKTKALELLRNYNEQNKILNREKRYLNFFKLTKHLKNISFASEPT